MFLQKVIMVATGQEMVREKILQGQGKVRFEENKYIYYFPSSFIVFYHLKFFCTFYGHESCCIGEYCSWNWTNGKLMLSFQDFFLACYVKEISIIHEHCTWLAESINKWVERMTVRRGLGPSPGLIWEMLIHLVREIIYLSGKSQGILIQAVPFL